MERQSTLIRQKVDSLPTFFPFFILAITLIQSIATIVAIIVGELAPIGILPNEVTDIAASLKDPIRKAEMTVYEEAFNPWIGAPIPFLITIGAKFTPCMREDHKINARNARIREEQIEDGGVGCCVNGNWVGSTSMSECAHSAGTANDTAFISGAVCSNSTTQYATLVNFHPCCISLTGRCQLLLEIDCEQRDGQYHPEAELCSQVSVPVCTSQFWYIQTVCAYMHNCVYMHACMLGYSCVQLHYSSCKNIFCIGNNILKGSFHEDHWMFVIMLKKLKNCDKISYCKKLYLKDCPLVRIY